MTHHPSTSVMLRAFARWRLLWITATWSRHALAVSGIVVLTWLAFGSEFRELGHRGDSWNYMLRFAEGEDILTVQPSRLALPWIWQLGFKIAGADPWIYHLASYFFLVGAAICLYGVIICFFPEHIVFAFSVAVLSALWPADPTRYDIATLGNRQAVYFLLVGSLVYFWAWRRRQPWWLVGTIVLLSLSLLTYEAPLFLFGVLPFVTLLDNRKFSKRWIGYAVATGVPVLVFGAATTITTLSGQEKYRDALWITAPSQFLSQLLAGLRVLFVESWSLPLQLLQIGAVPRLELVQVGTLLFVSWMVALNVADVIARQEISERSLWLIVPVGAISTVFGLVVFALSRIAMSQPDRTQTCSAIGASLFLCSVLWVALRRLPGHRLIYAACCTLLVALSFSMAAVYQRNFVQSWTEQKSVLRDISQQIVPPSDTLVMILGLPDTRIVFVSGYTCDFALRYLYQHPSLTLLPLLASESTQANSVEDFVPNSIFCALGYTGRSLDPWITTEFTPEGVLYRRGRQYAHVFPYDRLLLFQYSDNGTRLLSAIPPQLIPPGVSVEEYNPHALTGGLGLRPDAIGIIGR